MKRRRFKSNLRLLVHHPLTFCRVYRWELAVLFVGAVLDAVTTMRTVLAYGAETELHPVGRFVMQLLGPVAGTLVGKAAQVVCAVFVAALWRPWCGWLLVVCGVLYALAAVSNHFALL